jgi:hypothetical protein
MLGGSGTTAGRTSLRSVTTITSCKAQERSADWPENKHGLFAWFLAKGYAGAADKNRNNHLEPKELLGYLTEAMATAGKSLNVSQTPELFLPGICSVRLTKDAKAAIRRLAARLNDDRTRLQEIDGDYSSHGWFTACSC